MQTEVKIHSLAQTANEWIIYLEEIEGDRTLPIWVGAADGELMALHLSETALSHPLTHNLLLAAVEILGGTIERAVVLEQQENTYYAQLVLKQSEKELVLFARPFDAILAATFAKRPVYVEDGLLTKEADGAG